MELKLAAIKHLNYEEYLLLLGETGDSLNQRWVVYCSLTNWDLSPGRIQRLRKGGIHLEWGFSAQCSPRKMWNLEHMRVLLRPSESTITMQNIWQLEYNSGDWSYSGFSEPLPFGISLCIWGTATKLSRGRCRGAADLNALCLLDTKQWFI